MYVIKHSQSLKFQSSVTNTSSTIEKWELFRTRCRLQYHRLWLGTQRFELCVIDLLPGDEEIESGVKLLEVGILSDLRMDLFHVGSILELGDLDPQFFITRELEC